MSLPLYVIQGEVTRININQNENIEGIANNIKQTKISQYADHLNILRRNQTSAKHILNYFEKLKKATGSTINLEKN